MMADVGADFNKAIGLAFDLTSALGSIRSKRYSMLVDDGVVTQINVEPEDAPTGQTPQRRAQRATPPTRQRVTGLGSLSSVLSSSLLFLLLRSLVLAVVGHQGLNSAARLRLIGSSA